MAEQHKVNGKATKVGDHVHYTALDGSKHKATIDALSGNMANLTAMVNGNQQVHLSVQHSPHGVLHTWDHMDSE